MGSANMKTFLIALVVLVGLGQAQALGGWNEMACTKGSMCEKRFNKFLLPKIVQHLKHDGCSWSFCHVESGKYQVVNGMNLDFTGYVMAMGCQSGSGYKKCRVTGNTKEKLNINCEDKPMSEMTMHS